MVIKLWVPISNLKRPLPLSQGNKNLEMIFHHIRNVNFKLSAIVLSLYRLVTCRQFLSVSLFCPTSIFCKSVFKFPPKNCSNIFVKEDILEAIKVVIHGLCCSNKKICVCLCGCGLNMIRFFLGKDC